MSTIKQQLSNIREKQNIGLYDLSKRSGVAYSVLYYIENNRRDVHVSTALKIAKALNVTVEDLFEL